MTLNEKHELFKSVNFNKRKINIYKLTGIMQGQRERIRELVRIRDNHTCQKCGLKWTVGERKLDVHHIDCDNTKSRQCDKWEEEKDNMMTLCHKCHLNLPQHREKMTKSRV